MTGLVVGSGVSSVGNGVIICTGLLDGSGVSSVGLQSGVPHAGILVGSGAGISIGLQSGVLHAGILVGSGVSSVGKGDTGSSDGLHSGVPHAGMVVGSGVTSTIVGGEVSPTVSSSGQGVGEVVVMFIVKLAVVRSSPSSLMFLFLFLLRRLSPRSPAATRRSPPPLPGDCCVLLDAENARRTRRVLEYFILGR